MNLNGDEKRGDSRVILYLSGVTDQDTVDVAESLCDLAVERGWASDEDTNAVVAIEPWEWPATPEELVSRIGDHAAIIVLPNTEPDS